MNYERCSDSRYNNNRFKEKWRNYILAFSYPEWLGGFVYVQSYYHEAKSFL